MVLRTWVVEGADPYKRSYRLGRMVNDLERIHCGKMKIKNQGMCPEKAENIH